MSKTTRFGRRWLRAVMAFDIPPTQMSMGGQPTMRILMLCMFLMSLMLACSTEVGDACSSDTDCGRGRICDLASRGGYCTVTPCSANSCPENSVCVEFENEETFCMALCESTKDCRNGYRCDDEIGPTSVCREEQ
ncbi:MAG: hypothetical protein VX589_07510 [Myxococcota bacterium]|nr:hypothetical protein [Myxococcota bacterium]